MPPVQAKRRLKVGSPKLVLVSESDVEILESGWLIKGGEGNPKFILVETQIDSKKLFIKIPLELIWE